MSQLGCAEIGSAHRAILPVGVACLLEILQGQLGVEREMELVAPAEIKTGFREGIVADGGSGMSFRHIGGMGSYLIGNDTCAYIIFIGKRQVLLRGDVAQHCGAKPCYLRTTDGAGDMVVAGGDVGDDGTEGVEGGLVALLQLALHILTDFMHGHMARTLDEGLHILLPGTHHEFTHGVEFGKLGGIVGIGRTTGAQTVAQ